MTGEHEHQERKKNMRAEEQRLKKAETTIRQWANQMRQQTALRKTVQKIRQGYEHNDCDEKLRAEDL